MLQDRNIGASLIGLGISDALAHSRLESSFADLVGGGDTLHEFRRRFGSSQRVSIDSFLNGLPDDREGVASREIGAKLVAATLLFCEQHSVLDGDWYQWLLEFLLSEGKEFPAGVLSVVTFNYDRTLELYLWRAFKHAFGLSHSAACEWLNRIEFIHAYGSLGTLPEFGASGPIVPFGGIEYSSGASRGISLAGPRIDAGVDVRIQQVVAAASRVIFLGFGFWNENLDALHVPSHGSWMDSLALRTAPAGTWPGKRLYASRFRLWRSVYNQANTRFGMVTSPGNGYQPIVNWGDENQNVFEFVTHWNLKA